MGELFEEGKNRVVRAGRLAKANGILPRVTGETARTEQLVFVLLGERGIGRFLRGRGINARGLMLDSQARDQPAIFIAARWCRKLPCHRLGRGGNQDQTDSEEEQAQSHGDGIPGFDGQGSSTETRRNCRLKLTLGAEARVVIDSIWGVLELVTETGLISVAKALVRLVVSCTRKT